MENKVFKNLVLLLLLVSGTFLYGQRNNHGFLGKNMALGIGSQLSPGRYILGLPGSTKNNFYFEYATYKYQSITVNFSQKKVKLEYDDFSNVLSSYYDDELIENIVGNGPDYIVSMYTVDGSQLIKNTSIGLRYNFYYRRKTVAAPAGFCQYLRIDFLRCKTQENNLNYEVSKYQNLSEDQKKYALSKRPGLSTVNALSFGFGLESKKMLTSSLFISANVEVNINTFLLYGAADDNYLEYSRTDDLAERAVSTETYKNLFLLGLSAGILL